MQRPQTQLNQKRREMLNSKMGEKEKIAIPRRAFRAPKNKSQNIQVHTPQILPPGVDLIKQRSPSPQLQTAPISRNNEPISPVGNNYDPLMDSFLEKLLNKSISDTIELFFRTNLAAKQVIYWENVPSLGFLYSPSTLKTVPLMSGLVGYAFYSKTTINSPNPPAHPSFHPMADSKLLPLNAPALVFPLFNEKNQPVLVVEIIRPVNGEPFTSDDVQFSEWFQNKFSFLSKWIFPKPNLTKFTESIFNVVNNNDFMKNIRPVICQFFKARTFELWSLNTKTKEMFQYTDKMTKMNALSSGIAGHVLRANEMVNITNSRLHNAFIESLDGSDDLPFLGVPYLDAETNIIWACIFRGRQESQFFGNYEVNVLQEVIPQIVMAVKNSNIVTSLQDDLEAGRMEREGLTTILSAVQEVSKELNTEKLSDIIVEKARMLTHSDRCSLFLMNDTKDRLITTIQTGLDNYIDISVTRGIVGRTVKDGTTLIINDAYNNEYFDPTTDKETGYKTETILSAPIKNTAGEPIGVTQMVNKYGGNYTQNDARVIEVFNAFCGISIENAKLFKESLDNSKRLRAVVECAFSLSKTDKLTLLISDIMKLARLSIGADRAGVFVLDEKADMLKSILYEGTDKQILLPIDNGLAASCCKAKEGAISNNVQLDPRYDDTLNQQLGIRVTNLLVYPVLSNKGKVLGVAEMINKPSGFSKADLNLLQFFTSFTAMALQNQNVSAKLAADAGSTLSTEEENALNPEEEKKCEIPERLVLPEQIQQKLTLREVFQPDFSEDERVAELFYFFQHFDLMKKFNITAGLLYRFIMTIRETYNVIPYHNWTHAVDVTQFMVYQLEKAELSKVFSPFEILAILVATICHDANHNGFNNQYNEKAQLPLGILFKDMSVLEVYHCTVAIGIISKEKTNIFTGIPEEDIPRIWTIIIHMIKATDMKLHFSIVQKAQELLDSGKFDMNDPACRLLSMQLLLKVSDISNVSRPFDFANKWCDILNEEFFRQGDNEKKLGLGLSSPLNDRENADKPKGQIGFYNFICLPLYNVVKRIFPALSVNADSVSDNLKVWVQLGSKKKEAAAQQQQQQQQSQEQAQQPQQPQQEQKEEQK
ncbi:3'5'-cyclic nucleotide phosphodiesterase family protein [Trichomonas vaginalis G3]|uniref:3'5'-cyclic nucleotide phosphodiesterase family protein n=1 Tax=Trichomonas vaginalis (strain ATCC PRA-98 / G3) TaxID=412133 RepID=A2E8N2_TRIV3|nr:cyclic nucleotide phosphodiesterase family [Trichomonas vaginalis G3]EAY10971.1 3'5'-cyclic nucleotide phosphodiesterase family protein [Trichomonas vaginalis G3]KAI5530828.1 cyclic nucleotide phosphodiesterase family [Trichomonas vaginalis G3]|eukprot:XP_001323194.1 3'5'-cyclic nucleotide phosphodiesterase family protein [Trichomonas vaginalis G3]